jgi:hypothetical protein
MSGENSERALGNAKRDGPIVRPNLDLFFLRPQQTERKRFVFPPHNGRPDRPTLSIFRWRTQD